MLNFSFFLLSPYSWLPLGSLKRVINVWKFLWCRKLSISNSRETTKWFHMDHQTIFRAWWFSFALSIWGRLKMKSYVIFFQLPELFNPPSIICLIHSSYVALVSWHPGCSWEQLNSHMSGNTFPYVFTISKVLFYLIDFKYLSSHPSSHLHPHPSLWHESSGCPKRQQRRNEKNYSSREKHAFHRSSGWHIVKKWMRNKLNLASS